MHTRKNSTAAPAVVLAANKNIKVDDAED